MNLRILIRSISNNKLAFVIKLSGLTVALSSCFLILLFCFNELGYDSFHKNKDNIYRIVCKIYENGKDISATATVPAPVADLIYGKIPEIENFTRISIPYKDDIFKYKDNYIHEYGCYVDTAFLHIFSFPVISGDNGILKPNAILISEKLAKKYFGNENPVGKTVNNYGCGLNGAPLVISGVFKLPENTHFNLNIIQSGVEIDDKFNRNNNWNVYRHTYILLTPNANINDVEKKICQVVNDNKENNSGNQKIRYEFTLQKIEDIYLYSNLKSEAKANGDINLVRVLLFLALGIIIIAWINYLNLTVARLLETAKETGIRIILGASKKKIFINSLISSAGTNIIALLFSLVIIVLALPSLNHFVEKDLLEGMTLSFCLVFSGIFCTGILLLGFYPSLILTSLNNRDIIQGKFKYSRKGIVSRRIFMGVQFAASITIIMITLFVYKQIRFMKSYDKGFNPEQVICTDDNSFVKENVNLESFKAELLKFPQILNVTRAKTLPGNDVYLKEVIKRTDSDDSFNKIFEVMVADEDYIDVFQFKIIEGRKFSNKFSTDKQCVILNEEAVKCLDYSNPADAIDKEIVYRGKNYKIIGVIRNFNQLSLKYSIQPFAYFLGSQGFYAIKVKTANTKECISIIDNTIKKYREGTLKYRFVDDFYNEQYKNEVKFGKLFTCFSIIIICLSSIGLFGLALYLAQQRRKEMAIRAINGATHWKLLFLISKSYLVNIAVSFCIVYPLVYYSLNEWLRNFAYKTELNWWVFVLAGLITTAITILTVSWHSWKAASKNPVESLKYE